MMNRRNFLTCGAAALGSLSAFSNVLQAAQKPPHKTLIMVEFKGGNDGLNTLIPFSDAKYYDLRPNIGIQRDHIIQLNEHLGFHPSLKPIHSIWKNNDCAMVMGIGYPKPNRSHFRSIEIWDSASSSDEVLQTGWLNPILPNIDSAQHRIVDGIVIGNDAGALMGDNLRTINLKQNSNQFKSKKTIQQDISPALQHVLDIQSLLDTSSQYFKQQLKPLSNKHQFPNHRFAQDMMLAAQVIASGVDVPVIKISLGSFDTHGSQVKTHQRLLKQFAEGIAAFEASMKQHSLWNNILIMSYSEFGRRAAENGSKGTDHGTAAPHFIMGGKVNGGLFGQQPSLHNLSNNDLKHHVDFRQVYSSLEKYWFGTIGKNARQFESIPFI